MQRLAEGTFLASKLTEIVHTAEQEGLKGHPGGTFSPGQRLKGHLALLLGSR